MNVLETHRSELALDNLIGLNLIVCMNCHRIFFMLAVFVLYHIDFALSSQPLKNTIILILPGQPAHHVLAPQVLLKMP